jgi:hypothetical protein
MKWIVFILHGRYKRQWLVYKNELRTMTESQNEKERITKIYLKLLLFVLFHWSFETIWYSFDVLFFYSKHSLYLNIDVNVNTIM